MDDILGNFLASAGWRSADLTPIAGDLSARCYLRLSRNRESAVLMDARALPESVAPFLEMTHWLRALGLSAPGILAADETSGLLLLEDLGARPVAPMLENPDTRKATFEGLLDLLLTLRHASPPALHRPSAEDFCDWTRLADQFYPGADPDGLDAIRKGLLESLQPLCDVPAKVSLRDFHADNLIWMPGRTGIARFGLLDYQDAILTHPVYDLVSLLTDARTEIAPEIRRDTIAAYAAASGDDPDALNRAFAAFSIQRNLRILGIFHRSARVDGKSHHLAKLPRVYGYLSEAFRHPDFAALRPVFQNALPAPRVAA